MYWKVVKNNKPIDVLTELKFVRYHPLRDMILIADSINAEGILSSDNNTIWHWSILKEFPSDAIHKRTFDTVNVISINEKEYNLIKEALDTGQEIEEPDIIDDEISDDASIDYIKEKKIEQMSKTCNQIIEAGFDIELSDGETHHFSLTTEDQLNFITLSTMVASGQTLIPYHADGELCVFYSVEDATLILNKATEYKTYHVTYFNSLKTYINSLSTLDELDSIYYGIEIPEEYRSQVLVALMNGLSV